MSSTGKTGGLLSRLANPAARPPVGGPVTVSEEAEKAFGLAPAKEPGEAAVVGGAAPERSKTFFLPYPVCERLEMQKLSERREMKHIVRQALDEYFERHPLRRGVRDAFQGP